MSSNSSTEQLSEPSDSSKPEPPYHILSTKQKWNLVIFVSLAGAFSPLSSNIYFPAIDTISSDLGVNASLVALTITVYMVAQGIAPSLFGVFSDSCGRRLTFTISLGIYTAANLALAFTSSYPMLMVLRGVQAAGSAATISISAGVIADIASPQERGGFMGTNAGVRYVKQIPPVLRGTPYR
jgi:MFS family permease